MCYVGGASAGVIFHPVSDNLKFFLVVNTSEDQWRPFSEDFDGIRPLKRLICPLILWTKFFTKKVLLPLKKRVQNWTEFGPFRCCQRLKNRLLDRVVFGLLGSQKFKFYVYLYVIVKELSIPFQTENWINNTTKLRLLE